MSLLEDCLSISCLHCPLSRTGGYAKAKQLCTVVPVSLITAKWFFVSLISCKLNTTRGHPYRVALSPSRFNVFEVGGPQNY